MTRAGRGAGFTLLEVMVALAILAGALLAVSDVVTGALRNHARARDLETATLLARAKLAELEDRYEAKGFAPTEESDEGRFDDEGHPEIRWRVEVVPPPGELTPEALMQRLMGSEGGLAGLLPSAEEAPQMAAFQAQIAALMQGVLSKFADQLKRGVREVRLTVTWPAAPVEESLTVRTYLVVLAPGAGAGS